MNKPFNNFFRLFVFALSLSAAVFLTSCSKDDNNPVDPGGGNNNQQNKISFTGGARNGQTINLVGVGGGFSVSDNISAIILSGVSGTDSLWVTIAFPGSATGTFAWQNLGSGTGNEESGIIIALGNDPNSWLMSDGTAGSTVISTYGQVGQTIVGTFSGPVVGVNDNSNVTGSFSVTRVPNGE